MNHESTAAMPLEENTPDRPEATETPEFPRTQDGEGQSTQEADGASPAASPEDTPCPEPEGHQEGPDQLAEVPTAPAGDDSSPAAAPSSVAEDEKERIREEAHLSKMVLLHEELRRLNRSLIRTEDNKKEADREFSADIKRIEKEIKDVLCRMDEAEMSFASHHAPPHPEILPFEGPEEEPKEVPPETDPPAPASEEQEAPPLVPCETCSGTGVGLDEECRACMGAGKVIPQPKEEPKGAPRPCNICGHPCAAHFTAAGEPRPCVVDRCGCEAFIHPLTSEEEEELEDVPEEPEYIEIVSADLDAAAESYSASQIDIGSGICVKKGIAKPFERGGQLYCGIGVAYLAGGGIGYVEAYRLVSVGGDEAEAVVRDKSKGCYHGIRVHYRKSRFVMVGPRVRFVPKREVPDET